MKYTLSTIKFTFPHCRAHAHALTNAVPVWSSSKRKNKLPLNQLQTPLNASSTLSSNNIWSVGAAGEPLPVERCHQRDGDRGEATEVNPEHDEKREEKDSACL